MLPTKGDCGGNSLGKGKCYTSKVTKSVKEPKLGLRGAGFRDLLSNFCLKGKYDRPCAGEDTVITSIVSSWEQSEVSSLRPQKLGSRSTDLSYKAHREEYSQWLQLSLELHHGPSWRICPSHPILSSQRENT